LGRSSSSCRSPSDTGERDPDDPRGRWGRSPNNGGQFAPGARRAGWRGPGRPIPSIGIYYQGIQVSARPISLAVRRPIPSWTPILHSFPHHIIARSLWSVGGPSSGLREATGDDKAHMLARCRQRGARTPRRRPCVARNTSASLAQHMQRMGGRSGLAWPIRRRGETAINACMMPSVGRPTALNSVGDASIPPYSARKFRAEYAEYEEYDRPIGPAPDAERTSGTGAAPVGGEVAGRTRLRRRADEPAELPSEDGSSVPRTVGDSRLRGSNMCGAGTSEAGRRGGAA
jgi:hypothetical protein